MTAPSRETRAAFAPLTFGVAVYACSAGALVSVLIDAVLHADVARVCVGLPLALLCALVTYVPALGLVAALRVLASRQLALPIWTTLAMLALGFWLSNALLVDLPFDPLTKVGYAISAALALAAGILVRRACTSTAQHTVVVMAASCLVLFVVDLHASPVQYPGLHAALRVVLATALTTTLLLRGLPRHAWAASAAVVVLGMPLPLLPSSTVRSTVFARPSLEGFVFERLMQSPVRALAMRAAHANACSFSGNFALLQGPCPDVPLALPWAHEPAAETRATGRAPQKIVLLTVDAFRCGPHERPPFATACPRLQEEAAEVNSVRVSYPATGPALLDLHRGAYDAQDIGDRASWLAGNLSARGYPGVAIVTHRQLRSAPVQRSFDSWDESLLDRAASSIVASSAAISAAIVQRLRGPDRAFVWAHYYDPHDPYLPASGGHFTASGEAAYVDELKRTDDAIGVVLEAARRSNEPSIVVVTGDHGEGFGEHGATHHGYELYDNALRVPWVAMAFHGAMLPAEAPRQSVDIAAWLGAAAGGPQFHPQPPRPARTQRLWSLCDGVHKLILNRENGWLELYDLDADPRETRNLAGVDPATTQRMLAGLLAAINPKI